MNVWKINIDLSDNPNMLRIRVIKLVEIPDLQNSRYDRFIANIDATDRASMSFQVSGEVEVVDVRMGSVVKKGQLLAWLDPTDYQLAYDAKNAEYDLAYLE
ncbi:biotin/lipoyl-binding protein [Vibrio sp. TRT 2004]|uniref:biotin/lipoyl-binding protein n=1 Tax=Vibrio sp. TRT 2004 TaxID=3418506 RepID=UPI003CF998AE